jgi:hypothetical protein
MGWTPHYKRAPMIGLAVSALACAAMAFWSDSLDLLGFEVLLTLVGIGLGTQFPVTTVGVQNAVLAHELGTATANLNFFRSLGSAVLVAAYGAVFLGALGTVGTQIGDLDALAAEAVRNGKDLGAVFATVFAAASVTLAVSYIGLIFMKELPLKGRQ